MAVAITPTDSAIAINTSANPVVFTSLASGTPAADRISVVTISNRNRSVASSVTINGIAATLAQNASLSGPLMYTEIWYAANPSGTTATVSITFSNTASANVGVSIFSVTGANLAPVDTDTATNASAVSISISALTISSGGGAILSGAYGEQTVAVTWTNATEYEDDNVSSFRVSSAYTITAGTPTITMDGADGEPYLLVGAAWDASGAAIAYPWHTYQQMMTA